jgi:hypothetical protein
MIIKSMSRCGSNAGISQLLDYISDHTKERRIDPALEDGFESDAITWNMAAAPDELKNVAAELEENAELIPASRTKSVRIYHEILSFHKEDKAVITPEVTRTMALEYLAKRSPNGLGFAKTHYDRDSTHIHIIVSGNEFGSSKANRMDKFQFDRIKRDLELFQHENFPQIEHSTLYSREQEAERKRKRDDREVKQAFNNETQQRKDNELETIKRFKIEAKERLKRNPNLPTKEEPTRKEKLTHQIETALHAKSQADFERLLKIADPSLKLYKRGKNWAVSRIETPTRPTKANPNQEPKEIKYRLKTLMPEFDFEDRLKEWDQKPERKIEAIPQGAQQAPEPPNFSKTISAIHNESEPARAANFASQEVSRWSWKPTIQEPVRPRDRKEIERDEIRERAQKVRDQSERDWQKRAAELKKLPLSSKARRKLSRPAREGRYVSFDRGIDDGVPRFRVNQEGFELPVIRSGRVMDLERARAREQELKKIRTRQQDQRTEELSTTRVGKQSDPDQPKESRVLSGREFELQRMRADQKLKRDQERERKQKRKQDLNRSR